MSSGCSNSASYWSVYLCHLRSSYETFQVGVVIPIPYLRICRYLAQDYMRLSQKVQLQSLKGIDHNENTVLYAGISEICSLC